MFSGKAMEIVTPINTEKDYQKAPALIEPFLIKHIHKSGQSLIFFETMALLNEKQQSEHYPITLADLIEAIKLSMKQQELTTKNLAIAINQPKQIY